VKKSTIALSALMFSAPFLLLAYAFDALPSEIPIIRNPFAGATLVAPKSAFTVFRVPLINLTHGLMAGVLLSRSEGFKDEKRRAAYSAFFSTLLFAVALKSNLEALDISRLAASFGGWITVGTVASVIGGLALAFFRGRNAALPWPEVRFGTRDKIALAVLVGVYLALVAASF
jgi:hypothetical protein